MATILSKTVIVHGVELEERELARRRGALWKHYATMILSRMSERVEDPAAFAKRLGEIADALLAEHEKRFLPPAP